MSQAVFTKEQISQFIREEALALGFDACGFAAIDKVSGQDKERYLQWIGAGYNGKMAYMAKNQDLRLNPGLLLPEAKSVIVLAMNYFQQNHQPVKTSYKVASYAAGIDYHYVIKDKLRSLLSSIRSKTTAGNAKVFTDSAPVMERYWARKAGLGAHGKNSCLILPKKGSFYFLAEILIDIPLVYDSSFRKDLCGKCTRCIDACPTQALKGDGTMDARRCISYLTIELKDEITEEFKGLMQGNIFGCDICQLVCPHNKKFATPTRITEFMPLQEISSWENADWEKMDRSAFKSAFLKKSSPLSRVKFEKMQHNIAFARK